MSACYDEINAIHVAVIPPAPPPPPLPPLSVVNPSSSQRDVTRDSHGYSIVQKVRPTLTESVPSATATKKDVSSTSQPHEAFEMDFPEPKPAALSLPNLESPMTADDFGFKHRTKGTAIQPSVQESDLFYSLSLDRGSSYSLESGRKQENFVPAEYEELGNPDSNKKTRSHTGYDNISSSFSTPLPLEESLYSDTSGNPSKETPSASPCTRSKSEIRARRKPLLASASHPSNSQPATAKQFSSTASFTKNKQKKK